MYPTLADMFEYMWEILHFSGTNLFENPAATWTIQAVWLCYDIHDTTECCVFLYLWCRVYISL